MFSGGEGDVEGFEVWPGCNLTRASFLKVDRHSMRGEHFRQLRICQEMLFFGTRKNLDDGEGRRLLCSQMSLFRFAYRIGDSNTDANQQ
jgi:hypothetical protein